MIDESQITIHCPVYMSSMFRGVTRLSPLPVPVPSTTTTVCYRAPPPMVNRATCHTVQGFPCGLQRGPDRQQDLGDGGQRRLPRQPSVLHLPPPTGPDEASSGARLPRPVQAAGHGGGAQEDQQRDCEEAEQGRSYQSSRKRVLQ